MRIMSRFLALGAFFVLALGVAACGGGDSLPGNAVAKVGDETITRDQFEHWLQVAAVSSQGGQPGQQQSKPVVPDPPSFSRCIAQKRENAPKPAKGQPKPTEEQFKTQCEQEYEGLKQQVMQFLISSRWIQEEAEQQDVSISEEEVEKQFQQTKKQSFPKEKDFQQFLKSSGMTLEDIKFRVKLDALSNKLREKITKGKDKVSDEQISTYYDKNKARFAQPERRDLRIVLTKNRERAQQARQALQGGRSWKEVAKEFSIDQASKNQGGVLLGVAQGQQEKALDEAVFKAEVGELQGPVKTQFGWYVFQVGKITPKSQQSLKDATPTIKQLLASQNQQKALDEFVKDFRDEWKSKTVCRKGFVTQDCKNAPKPKTTTTGAGQPGESGEPAQPGQPQPVQPPPSE